MTKNTAMRSSTVQVRTVRHQCDLMLVVLALYKGLTGSINRSIVDLNLYNYVI